MTKDFELPKQLEALRDRKIWVNYVMIWNDKKHNGHGGYDKPPVNPYTLYNGSTDSPESLSTFSEAISNLGKTAHVRVKDHDGIVDSEIVGVGIALSGTGVFGIDLDNVVRIERDDNGNEKRFMTSEAHQIMTSIGSYTEISPSGEGLHILALGKLPENVKKIAKPKPDIFHTEKAEYQLFDSGYMTISGRVVGSFDIGEKSEEIAVVYERFFREVAPIDTLDQKKPDVRRILSPAKRNLSPVVSGVSGYTFERWDKEMDSLSEEDILGRIFESGSTGAKVKSLYDGDMSDYDNDHSRADQALVSFLYSFTQDRNLTERFFRSSKLYRETGKSKNYIKRTLDKAESASAPLVGHIIFTREELKQYAQKKELEELAQWEKDHPDSGERLAERARAWKTQHNK